ncbi:breast cancer type 2 susceptibility protein [Leuresthes tenuis]|uniref:breast cancer type 2 susceptibility protein n=1 Tax=Leuresthes tenuis TaxID=355514 RepID=UPI003B50664C
MDLPTKNMYDVFKDDIWKELGPLDPNWFEILTTQTTVHQGNVSDQEYTCTYQEGLFKTPLEKSSVDSQMFSTPKVFRHSRILSPETEDEQSFTNAKDKGTLPWTATDSPCILQGVPGGKCGGIQPQSEDSFDLLNTPNKSPVSYAKHISESLGAQINPDISWTSSLNTPPAVQSTLILSKTDESPCSVSVTADRNVIFVRKLFPSVSEASTVGVPKNMDMPVVSQGPVSSEAHNCPQTSQNQRESLWSQKVPDSIKDGEICSTVAEKVPCVLFANSSSALRKVKPDRNKRKQIVQTKDGCSSKVVTTTPNAASREKETANLEPGKFPSSPLMKTRDKAISQWSPLSLSEIPPCTEESNIVTEHPSLQFSRPSVKISDSGFIRKKRKFVYTVGTLKPQLKENEVAAQKMDSSPGIPDSGQEVSLKQLETASDETSCCSTGKTAVKKPRRLSGESLLYSAEAKMQDLDMSQLCRDFAQDFSQMSESGQQSKVAENTQHNFSPSACLSVMKQAKQKVRQANLHHNSVGSSDSRHVSTTNQNCSISEGSGSDSGFQTAFSNITHTTAPSFGPPCTDDTGQSSTTDIHMTTPFPATRKGNEKVHLDAEAETTLIGGQRSNERQTVDLGRESESCIKSTLTQQPSSTQGTVDNIDCVPLNGPIHGSLPEKTSVSVPSVHASGFKTASNKGIHVSSANLERAKRLFQETDGEKAFSGQPIKCDNAIKHKSSMSKRTTSSTDQLPSLRKALGSQLTASQRADVTELCSLLEEADSQFEFTQFKTAKQKRHGQSDSTSPQKADKEVDPDFLTGIDFDDSFNDGISNATIQSTDMSPPSTLKKENSSVPPSSEHIFEDGRCAVSTELGNLQRADHNEARKMENSSTLMPGVAFKTAGGRVLRVSRKCLSKARALFADLEENLADQESPGKQQSQTATKTEQKISMDSNMCKKDLKRIQDGFCSNKRVTVVEVECDSGSFEKSKTDKATCQSGFHMASGKQISISVKCMQQAEAFFKDCGVMDSNDGEFDKRSINPVCEDVGNKKSLSKYKNIQVSISEEPVNGCTKSENVNGRLFAQHIQGPHVDKGEMSSNGTLALKHKASLNENPFSTSGTFSSLLCTTSKNTDSYGIDELGSGDGFCTASGKKVSVSADAMKRAESLLNEMRTPVDINSQPSQKGKTLGTGQLTTQVLPPENCGFQTAGGKELSISLAALKKAKTLFSECEGVENNSVSSPHSKIPATRPTLCNRGFFAASGKAVALSSEALQKAKAFFTDISLSTDIPSVSDTMSEKKHKDAQENFEQIHCGVTNAEGAEVHASQRNVLKAEHASKELDDFVLTKAMQEADAFFNHCETDCDNADLAKDEKSKVPVSVVGSKEKNLTTLNPGQDTPEEPGNGCAEDTDRRVKQKEDIFLPQKSGFQTARGRAVAASSEKLKRAKTLFNECQGVEDEKETTLPQSTINALPFRGGGFRAASGKPVELSSEALQKAKSLFGDISVSAEVPDVSHTRKSDNKKQHSGDNTGKRQLGFTTAGGAQVRVSQKSLMKAKHLMKELGASAVQEEDAFFKYREVDGKNTMLSKDETSKAPLREGGSEKNNLIPLSPDQKVAESISEEPGNGYTEDADEQVNQRVDTLPAGNNGFQTASGKAVAVSSENLKRAKTLFNEWEGGVDGIGTTPPLSKVPALPFRGGGFRAASGKPVELSSEALQKAKSLFGDISVSAEVPDVSHTRKSDNKKQHSGDNTGKRQLGFTTAGGAQVRVSQKSLMKAKHLMKELGASAVQEEDAFFKYCEVDGKNTMLSKDETSKAPLREGGSEKNNLIPLSPDQKVAESISEEPGNGYTEDADEQVNQRVDTLPAGNNGFQTASGKAVAVSSENLKRAKTLFNEWEGGVDGIGTTPPLSKVPALPFRGGGFRAASGKPVELSSEALQKAKSLFGDISVSAEVPDVSHTRKSDKKQHSGDNTGKRQLGFTTAGGAQVRVSQKSLMKAKHLMKEFSDSASAVQDTNDVDKSSEMSHNHISIAPMSESDSKKENVSKLSPVDMSGNRSTKGTDGQVKLKEETFSPQNSGFQTAGGKAVVISSEALKRAETLLSECKGAEDKIVASLPHSISAPPLKNRGFFAASGKPVEFSDEALENVKALFSDISMSAGILSASDTKRSDEEHEYAENDPAKVRCGFRTAKGGKVHVSEENLLKAKHVLKEFDDLILTQAMNDADAFFKESADGELERSKVKDVKRTSNSNAASASDRDIPARRRAPSGVQSFHSLQPIDHKNKTAESLSVQDKTLTDVFKCQEHQIVSSVVGDVYGRPGQEKSFLLDCEVIRADKSSDLNLQSLNLTGCTENQQKLFAQEALDCTKALLEDEGLGGQSLSMTFENELLKDDPKFSNKSTKEETGRRKRTVGDSDLTGQPPLKRRLLEEFDRTFDGPRGSALHPVKSCPNGLMKDRGVFKYSVHHQPNITKPHRDGKNYVDMRFQKTTQTQGSAPGGSGSAQSKMPTFVPPVFKNTKTEAQKNPVFKENSVTPVFVPPFKTKRTLVQEGSPKQHDEEDKSQHSFIMQSNRNTYVPPTKKIQGTADVKTLVDTTNDDMNNGSVPVDWGSVSCGAEASHVDDTFSRGRDISQNLQNIELARDMQDMRIRKKKRQNIRPLPGSLFLTKTSGVARIPLKVAVNGKPPARYTSEQLYRYGVHRHVSEISSETAECFRFSLLHFIKQETLIDEGGVQLADGGWLMPSNDWTAGKDEFFRALCDTPGLDPKLISEAWVYNHYKWIVWKQASMERSFPETMGGLCLSPEQVLLQLKYRYDIEVDHSRRPALRKIMERDDTAVKTLVLCICEIVSRGHSPNGQNRNETKTPQSADTKAEASSAVVGLTDGWYAIKAQLDEPLAAMLHRGLLAVGVKLIIHGAQLVGSQDACSPLEAPESLMLKICANSCRRARWDAKLGFHRDPRPFLLPVSCLYSNGGSVGCVDIIILRSYPIQWMERKPDGGIVFRSARAEEKEARRYNSHKQKAMEMLFAKIQAEFEKEDKGNIKPQRRRQTISHQDIAKLQDGEELYEAVADDVAYLEAHLSEQQLEALRSYRRSVMDKKQAELQDRYRRALEAEDNEKICPKRDVTPVWRLCITDSTAQPGCGYQLNLWRPSSDLQSLLKEGCRYKVYNLVTSDGKRRSSIETVQLTGTKKTQFQELKTSQEWLTARFQPRVSTDFVNLQNEEFQPLCGEVDLTGYVISVIDGQGSSPAFYLADEKLNFVKVRFFSSLSQAGLEDVIKPHALLALSNLQLRGQSIFPTPVVYAGDLTVFSTNPKEVHLQESLNHLKSLLQRQENFFLNAEEKLSQLVNSEGLGSISSVALQPRTPASTMERKQDSKTAVTFQKGTRSLGSFTPVSKNPPAASTSTEKDPRSLKRRKALDYLSRVPSPPPLSFLSSLASPCVKKTFNPPRRSGTPSTLKAVQTPIKKPADSVVEDEWVNDEELAMIDTQALHVGDSL